MLLLRDLCRGHGGGTENQEEVKWVKTNKKKESQVVEESTEESETSDDELLVVLGRAVE